MKTFLLLIFYVANIYGQGTIKGLVSDSLSSKQPVVTAGSKTTLANQAKSQDKEINLQVSSNIIKNVIAGEKLQDMPDENIPVALSRLPGVSIMYNSVPVYIYFLGGFGWATPGPHINFMPADDFTLPKDPVASILIRGLDAGYYNITINGIRIPPASAINKSIDMNNLSERDFQNIEVHKTITSDEDGDATAGAINMITEKAPYKRIIKVEALGNYNGLDKSRNQYNFIGSYGERFFNNKLGVLANVHIEKKIMSSESQNTSDNFNYFNSSYTNAIRKRNEADILLDNVTPDGGSITFHNIFNKTNTDNFKSEADSGFGDPSIWGPTLNFTEKKTEQELFLSSLGGSNHLFGFDIHWNAAFSEARHNLPYNYTLSFWQNSDFFTGKPYGIFFLDHAFDIPTKNYSKEKTLSLDIHKKYALSSEITGELKLGGKYRINSRSYFENSHLEITKNIGLYNIQDHFGYRIGLGNYTIQLINKDSLLSFRQSTLSQYDTTNGADINSYDWSQRVSAAYVMNTFNFRGSAIFIAGLRIENEHNDFSGYYYPGYMQDDYRRYPGDPIVLVAQDILYNTLPERTRTFHYDKTTILPNFQMILKPTDYLNLRLAVYKTLIRPPAIARIPKYIAITTQTVSGLTYLNMGNPDLKNANVWNYEFQLQFHGSDIGQFTIDAFYKEIDGMIQATNGMSLKDSNSVKSLGINVYNYVDQFPPPPTPISGNWFNLLSYINSSKPTRIWGFEFSHKATFRYLPGLLKNIVLNYNLTFLRSEAWTKELSAINITAQKTLTTLTDKSEKLSDMPEFFANANLGYDIDGFSFRISYYYQDEYQMYGSSVNEFNFTNPITRNRYSRLDIALRQRILKHIFFNLDLNNITNSKEESIIKYPHYYYFRSLYPNGQTAQAYIYGMNIDFGVGIEL